MKYPNGNETIEDNGIISVFMGTFRFMSNMHTCIITLRNRNYQSVEHFYQACKATNKADFELVANAKDPYEAKRLGRKIKCRNDWNDVKDDVMQAGIDAKFIIGTKLAQKLIDTYPYILEEGNGCGDRYWGVDYAGRGYNKLGKMLMAKREELMEGMSIQKLPIGLIRVYPDIGKEPRGMCCFPYYGHPKRCPNFNKCDRCPPKVPMFDEYFDISQPVYAAYQEFDLAKHAANLKEKHPGWSGEQCRCVLYWQKGVRSVLNRRCDDYLKYLPNGYEWNQTPEAMGVWVFNTMKVAGIEMEGYKSKEEWQEETLTGVKKECEPIQIVRLVAMFGKRRVKD